jgi:hypothetical protein
MIPSNCVTEKDKRGAIKRFPTDLFFVVTNVTNLKLCLSCESCMPSEQSHAITRRDQFLMNGGFQRTPAEHSVDYFVALLRHFTILKKATKTFNQICVCTLIRRAVHGRVETYYLSKTWQSATEVSIVTHTAN